MEPAAVEPALVLAGRWPLIGPSEELPHHSPDQPTPVRHGSEVDAPFFLEWVI